MQEFDDAIVSIEENATVPQMQKSKTDVVKKQRRELTKANIDGKFSGQTLEDIIKTEGTGTYDQFKGKHTSYDEGKYTSKLDESKITAEQRSVAEKAEREIMTAVSDNRHLAEERGQIELRDNDEEAAYSGVIRKKHFKLAKGYRRSKFDQMDDKACKQKQTSLFQQWESIISSAAPKKLNQGSQEKRMSANAKPFTPGGQTFKKPEPKKQETPYW